MDTGGPYDTIACDFDDGVVTLTLKRPDKLNSFNVAMHQEIQHVLTRIQQDQTVRCLVLCGSGRSFSTGQDLSELDRSAVGDTLEKYYNPLVRTLTTLNIPVIASVNGVAAGAAANLALACDIVIAARSAAFIQSFSHLGLIPGCGGTWTLPRLIGLARATAVCMTAEPIPAEKAEVWGMIWKCVDEEQLQAETSALAHRLAHQATVGLAYTKMLLRFSQTRSFEDQLNLERDFQDAASKTDDFNEGVDAFLARRKAIFKGR